MFDVFLFCRIIDDSSLQRDGEDTNLVVGVTSEKSLSVSGPGEGGTFRVVGLLSDVDEVGLELVDDRLRLEIEDFDAGSGSGAEPVSVGGEDESVDGVSSFEGVEMLSLVEIPQHGDSVFSSGSAERSIGRNGNGGDVSGVTEVVRS